MRGAPQSKFSTLIRRINARKSASANDVGATAGPLAGGFVLYFTVSYSVTYLLVGVLGVLTLLVVLLLPDVDRSLRETKTFTARAAEFRRGLAEVLRTPPIFLAAGIEAVMYLGYGAFLGFLPIYARNVGLNDAEIAIVFGAQLTLAMVAKPIAGRVSDRVGRIPVIVISLLLCAAALPLIDRTACLRWSNSNSEMSAQNIPLKARTDFRESNRILATETVPV